MPRLDLLFIGDAGDGPVGEPVLITSRDQALQLLGGYTYQRFALTSGSTGTTLAVTPWGGDVTVLRMDSDGVLVPKDLFEFSVSGNVLSWSAPGDGAPDDDPAAMSPSFSGEVIFRVLTEPGPTSLLAGVLAAIDTGIPIYTLRVGGVEATSATAGGFRFTARHAGSRYNNTQVIVSSGTVTFRPAPGTGRTRTYTPTSDSHFRQLFQSDYDRGYHNLVFIGDGSNSSLTIPEGAHILVGGTDGSFDLPALQLLVEDLDLGGVDILCPMGLTATQLAEGGIPASLGDPYYPTLLVAQAATSGAALSGTVNTNKNLVSLGFQLQYDSGTAFQRTGPAAPLVASIIAATRFGITLAKLPAYPAVPSYNQEELHAVTNQGHTLAYESISKGWALYLGVTGNSDWSISTFRAYQELVWVLFQHLEPLLGNTILTMDTLDNELAAGFAQVTTGRVLDWNLVRIGDSLYVDVLFQPYGEVRSISSRISLGTPADPIVT